MQEWETKCLPQSIGTWTKVLTQLSGFASATNENHWRETKNRLRKWILYAKYKYIRIRTQIRCEPFTHAKTFLLFLVRDSFRKILIGSAQVDRMIEMLLKIRYSLSNSLKWRIYRFRWILTNVATVDFSLSKTKDPFFFLSKIK